MRALTHLGIAGAAVLVESVGEVLLRLVASCLPLRIHLVGLSLN